MHLRCAGYGTGLPASALQSNLGLYSNITNHKYFSELVLQNVKCTGYIFLTGFLFSQMRSLSTSLPKSEWTFQCLTELPLGFIMPATISLGLFFCVFDFPDPDELQGLSSILFLSELIACLLCGFKIICLLMSPNGVNLF